MARLGKDRIRAGIEGDYRIIEFVVNVNVEGEFTTTLSEEDVLFIKSCGVILMQNRAGREGFFYDQTKSGLSKKVNDVFEQCYSREMIEEKIVLKYSFVTVGDYGLSMSGEIVPHLAWKLDGNLDLDTYWQHGTNIGSNTFTISTGVRMYISAQYKRTYKYLKGDNKIEYKSISMHNEPDKEKYNLSFITSLNHQSIPKYGKVQEMDYTEERAKFFVDMYKNLCKLSNAISKFVEPDKLIELINSGKSLLESNDGHTD